MKTEIINLKSAANTSELESNSLNPNLNEMFSETNCTYIDAFKLFVAHFNTIPNYITEIEIDCKKANKWFSNTYGNVIKHMYFNKRYFGAKKNAEYDDIFYILFEDLIVYFDTNRSSVVSLFRKTEMLTIENIMNGIKRFKKRPQKEQSDLYLLVNSLRGIETKSLNIPKSKLSIKDNYNEDFSEIHKLILKRLSKKNDKGLVILHGKPGTGKTSYIRFLISMLKKDIIFLPPNMASAITNPDLISVLIDNQNSIFVIEDAENIILDREKNGNSPVSALLNISDGLLSDCLNIQLICSFNTDISRVDKALMRKGRLIAKYEFKELEVEKALALSNKLGFKTEIFTPMTLAAIYNQEEKDFQQSKRNNIIGFKAA